MIGTERIGLAAPVPWLKTETTPMQASTRPMVRLPESPRKIRAGEWLCGRKPRQEPASASVSRVTMTLPDSALITASERLMQAVTRASQDVEDYDRASELEQLGGQIIELAPSQWKTIAEARGA